MAITVTSWPVTGALQCEKSLPLPAMMPMRATQVHPTKGA